MLFEHIRTQITFSDNDNDNDSLLHIVAFKNDIQCVYIGSKKKH